MTVGSQLATSNLSTTHMGASRREERLARARLSRVAEIAGKFHLYLIGSNRTVSNSNTGMSSEQRGDLLDAQASTDFDTAAGDMDVDDAYMCPPVGAEGAEHSHVGGEAGLLQEIQEELEKQKFQYVLPLCYTSPIDENLVDKKTPASEVAELGLRKNTGTSNFHVWLSHICSGDTREGSQKSF